ncbi:trypsin-like serine protease [Clostridium sp. P21]|uniref:Trypsin-like serine protease n=1 Tax=Clostridium muellerianum TaxID=2716538 RepID=A0A7Y0EKL7_9CLOT|nr:trypsin-like serine protease [Clostridium muellerianum]
MIPSVVGITSTFAGARNKDVQGVGSGMILDSNGYILTNNHVAGTNTKSIKVSLYDGRDVSANSIWSNESLDLSILKVNEKNLVPVQLGDSSKVRIGESAIAIGNPLGLKFQRTVTSGIISAINRTIEASEGTFMEDLIQTDASINPGNSGGPLSNINGEVIAINSAKITSAEGIGFAVPINIVKPVLKSLKETGKFDTPVIGIVGFDKSMAGYLNINFEKGIYIYDIAAGSGSYEAGLKKGDIILSINGKELKSMNDLRETVYTIGAGNTIKVTAKTSTGNKDFNVKIKSSS